MAVIHHSAICASDIEASLRFYRDGLGLQVLFDQHFTGDWPELFEARSNGLRSVMLGDPGQPGAGVVELVVFDEWPDAREEREEDAARPEQPAAGFFLLSLFTDVDATLGRLASLGHGDVRRISVPGPNGPVPMATVRDPDGVLVELIGAASP